MRTGVVCPLAEGPVLWARATLPFADSLCGPWQTRKALTCNAITCEKSVQLSGILNPTELTAFQANILDQHVLD